MPSCFQRESKAMRKAHFLFVKSETKILKFKTPNGIPGKLKMF